MWICPKCKREFKRTNQSHYCGNAFKTVEEYIEWQSSKTHAHLYEIRNIILKSIPDIHECVKWSMPTYTKKDQSVSFAACNNHVSLYVDNKVIEKFKFELREWKTNKNAIYFPYHQTLPLELIQNMIEYSFQ